MCPLRHVLLWSSFLVGLSTFAQLGRTVRGVVSDVDGGLSLPGATVLLLNTADTTDRKGVPTDLDGRFALSGTADGDYILRVSFIGYVTEQRSLAVRADVADLRFQLRASSVALKTLEVEAVMKRVEQRGDTTIHNANAYQVNPDATAEDLITKMPGITSEGGTVKAQGETVKRVLVDGEEFFGDDANIALKNLPAEIIDKVEVFDRATDQSQFTGFDDGNREKTLNIVTKSGKNQGVFGRAVAGYGTDERYLGSLSLNRFQGTQRITVLGQLNNINQQNFSAQDLVGVSESSGGSGSARGGRGGGTRAGSDFLVGSQPGINTTRSFGLNYSDKFGKNTKLSGSYFFSGQSSANTALSDRTTYLSDSVAQYATNRSERSSTNSDHRLSLRLEHSFDSTNSIILSPRIGLQRYNSSSLSSAQVTDDAARLLSSTSNDNRSRREGLSFTNSLLYRRKFALRGRTFSMNLSTSLNGQSTEGTLLADNWYSTDTLSTIRLDQRSDGENVTQRHGLDVNYTEPVGKKGQVQFNIAPAIQLSDADKITNDIDQDTGEELLNTRLSNRADNTIRTLRGGLGYRVRGERLTFNLGLEGLGTAMQSEQTYPFDVTVERSFLNVLPNAMLMFRPDKKTRWRLNYRTSTRTPSIAQLQRVVDNTDPLKLTTGNLALAQGYLHNVSVNFNTSDSSRTKPFFAMLMVQAEQDRISNVTYAPRVDSTMADGTVLPAGAQLTMPRNLDGYVSGRLFSNYTMPLTALKSNLSLSAGGSVERLPGAVNDVVSFNWNTNWNLGANVSSSLSKNIDFRLGYSANFNTARSELRSSLNNDYFQGRLNGRLVLNGWNGWVLENELNYDQYVGLGAGFDQDAFVWNAALGHKFLKNDALELRVTAYDILKRNVSVAREVSDTYIQNTVTNMLQRYVMFSVTYNLRAFKSAPADRTMPGAPPFDGPPPPGR